MTKKLTLEEFKEKVRIANNNRYTYDKVTEYNGNKSYIIVTCPIHGDFTLRADAHLRGVGCKKCAIEKSRKERMFSFDEFKKKAEEIHKNKDGSPRYKYLNYNGMDNDVDIICPIHGKFTMKAKNHIHLKNGCRYCFKTPKKTLEQFKDELIKILGDKYILDNIVYKNAKTKVELICRKHGSFKALPRDLLQGKGCLYCRESKLERKTAMILDSLSIKYERFKKFDWLKLNKYSSMSFDFYIPKFNLAIECQGIQHFTTNGTNYNKDGKIFERDETKYRILNEHNLNILYVMLDKYDIDKVLNDERFVIYTKDNLIQIKDFEEYIKKLLL